MSFEDEMANEEQDLCDQLNRGKITDSEYSTQVNELYREYRSMRDEACQEAYDNELNNWQ